DCCSVSSAIRVSVPFQRSAASSSTWRLWSEAGSPPSRRGRRPVLGVHRKRGAEMRNLEQKVRGEPQSLVPSPYTPVRFDPCRLGGASSWLAQTAGSGA